MGLSRRQFTKEFKLTAVRRLEQGVSLAEVARALEVNPNVLHRWRRELQEHGAHAVADATDLAAKHLVRGTRRLRAGHGGLCCESALAARPGPHRQAQSGGA